FGFVTTFPHCPRCKKASSEKGRKTYQSTPKTCDACGHVYIPADTYSSKPDEFDVAHLKQTLTPAHYELLCAARNKRHAHKDDPRAELLAARSNPDRRTTNSLVSRLWRRLTHRS